MCRKHWTQVVLDIALYNFVAGMYTRAHIYLCITECTKRCKYVQESGGA